MDSNKIVEILFDHSEEIRNDVYINIMYPMKQYHDHRNNETEVINSLNTLEPSIFSKIKSYIRTENEGFKLCNCIMATLISIALVTAFVALTCESKWRH